MLSKIKQLIVGLAQQGDAEASGRETRFAVVGAAAAARSPGRFKSLLDGISAGAEAHAAITDQWLEPEQINAGETGPFDACDLRAWLLIAEAANIEAIPATEILRLTDEEVEALGGIIDLSQSPRTKRAAAAISKAAAGLASELAAHDDNLANHDTPAKKPIDIEKLQERLFSAMDNLPSQWMVRSHLCGNTNLKALAGCGLLEDAMPEARFGSNLEIGPGWVRIGNRRRIDVSDHRTTQAYIRSAHRGLTYLARPWVKASRFLHGTDPHRAGTPFGDQGAWPAEWRAFVKNGQVVGVASYYGWADEATPATARTVLNVRSNAQKLANTCSQMKLVPQYIDLEMLRRNGNSAEIIGDWDDGEISFTADFIETDEGLVLLECGPGATPVGGGHPCAFAGCGGLPRHGNPPATEGAAFRIMEHINLGDPSTWHDGNRNGCILTWEEVLSLCEQDPSAVS